jgi:protein AroM
VATGEAVSLDEAAGRLGQAELIPIHSVGYAEQNARHVAAATGRPVATARRIIAGAMRLHPTDPVASGRSSPGRTAVQR